MQEKLIYIKLQDIHFEKINIIVKNDNRNLYIILIKFKFIF